MSIFTGHLLLGGVETGNPDAEWLFNIEKINGVLVLPKKADEASGTQGSMTNENSKRNMRMLDMTPEEYRLYREEWERTKSSRVIGGETKLRNGDYLTVYSDETRSETIWLGTVCLVECEIYYNRSLPDFSVALSQVDTDLTYWSNMFINGMPAKLESNFGLEQN